MTKYPTWTLPDDIPGAGESPLLEEYCTGCSDITYHEPAQVRMNTRPNSAKDLMALLFCIRCGQLHYTFKADFIPPLPPGFEIGEDRLIRRKEA